MGFLVAEIERDTGRKGPPRVYYSLTGKGARVLAEVKEALAQLASGKLWDAETETASTPEAVLPIAARTSASVLTPNFQGGEAR